MTTRQKQLVENYIRLKVRKMISEKKVLKEGTIQKDYNKITELYRQATEYSQSPQDIALLTKALAEFFNQKVKSLNKNQGK